MMPVLGVLVFPDFSSSSLVEASIESSKYLLGVPERNALPGRERFVG